jgi:hypothetical protein
MITRRTLLKSAAAALGLALVPKGVKALVAPSDDVTVAQYAAWVGRIMSAPSKATMMIVGGRLITLVDGRWRMGLIDRNHVPEGTKLEEWEVRAVDTDTGYFADVADDIEQWWIGAGGRLFCSDSRPDMHLDKHPNLRASQGACYTGKVHVALFRPIHFVYTGPHPIYSRLFPVPSPSL